MYFFLLYKHILKEKCFHFVFRGVEWENNSLGVVCAWHEGSVCVCQSVYAENQRKMQRVSLGMTTFGLSACFGG